MDCFREGPQPDFGQQVAEKFRPMTFIARVDGQAIGFELGYERNREKFFLTEGFGIEGTRHDPERGLWVIMRKHLQRP